MKKLQTKQLQVQERELTIAEKQIKNQRELAEIAKDAEAKDRKDSRELENQRNKRLVTALSIGFAGKYLEKDKAEKLSYHEHKD